MIGYIVFLLAGVVIGYAFKDSIATAIGKAKTTIEEDVKAFEEVEGKVSEKAKQVLSTLKEDEKALVEKYLALKKKLGK